MLEMLIVMEPTVVVANLASSQNRSRRVNRLLFWLMILISNAYTATQLIAQNEENVSAEKVAPLVNAYAENDYTQKRPLMNAIELGYRYIEADTFLVDEVLMIGYSVLDMQSKGSLETLYFAPLKKLVDEGSDFIKGSDSPLHLVIDIKSEPLLSYRALRILLGKYASMLTKVVDGQVHPGAITVVVSGNCARESIAAENPRYAAIDGRITDIDSDIPTHLIPMISARWGSHFRWLGNSEFTKTEQLRLKAIVDRAHAKNRVIRFWSTPDVDLVWTTLRLSEVDLLGAEQYSKLSEFLVPRKSPFDP